LQQEAQRASRGGKRGGKGGGGKKTGGGRAFIDPITRKITTIHSTENVVADQGSPKPKKKKNNKKKKAGVDSPAVTSSGPSPRGSVTENDEGVRPRASASENFSGPRPSGSGPRVTMKKRDGTTDSFNLS
jgi:hypothetical protein